MKILIVDDEPWVKMIFTKILGEHGHSVQHCISAEEAFSYVQSDPSLKVMFLDIRLPGMDGIAALPKFLQINPSLRIIMMTAYQTVESVVKAMKSGAVDYLVKPLDPQMVMQALQKYGSAVSPVIADQESISEPRSSFPPRKSGDIIGTIPEFVAHTPMMKSVLSTATQFALTDDTVLILGESGSGKEILAHYIHQKSARSRNPFIVIDCASIPESLFESELFGYEKGAFTGADSFKEGRMEQAAGGTLFLDEIGNVPLSMQAKLLRFIEDHALTRLGGKKTVTLDIRLIAATNLDLPKVVEKGTFREDLYYRLAGLVIHLPPLRNRPKEEKEFLVNYFLQKNVRKLKKPVPVVSESVRHIILEYSWPGNVRELQNALYSATLLCDSTTLELSHLPIGIQSYFSHRNLPPTIMVEEDKTLKQILEKVKREQILSVLKQTGGNKKKASEILGMDYKSFLTKLKEYTRENGSYQ